MDALDQKLKEEAEIREATLKVAPAQRAAIEQEIRARNALKQSIEAWKAAENVTQEIADARALAAARNISTEAGLVEARELATEAVIRQAVKGLTDEQAKAIAELIRVRDQEKRSADVAGQATGLRESIADQSRLNEAKRLGIRAGQDAVRELQDEIEVRRAVSGLVGEERARIEALTRAEQASRRTGDQKDFLNAQREELRITLLRQQAEERGPDAVRALNRELAIQQAVLQSGAKVGSAYEKQVRDIAARNYDAANRVKSVWVDALHKIKEEAQGQGSLFHDLAQAWVEGGIGGIVTLAKAKIKENIASGIEELAKAFGSFALGNPAAGALHLKSAAEHGAAALAWEAVAGAGGGGGANAGSTAGLAGGAPNLGGSAAMQPPGPEVNIYLEGPGFDAMNPTVRRVVAGAVELSKEINGRNARVHLHRVP